MYTYKSNSFFNQNYILINILMKIAKQLQLETNLIFL